MRALVQHHAADELHVEMALAERALGRLAHRREGRDEDVVEGLAVGELALKSSVRARSVRVRQGSHLRLERVDRRDPGPIGLDAPVVGGAENLLGESTEHGKILAVRTSRLGQRGRAASET